MRAKLLHSFEKEAVKQTKSFMVYEEFHGGKDKLKVTTIFFSKNRLIHIIKNPVLMSYFFIFFLFFITLFSSYISANLVLKTASLCISLR